MAKGKSRKFARAYRRGKRQTRRIARNKASAAKAAVEAKQKRTANLFQNVLGIVAASGYNENVLRQALSISKATRSNYLTNSLLRKAKKEKERQWKLSHADANPLHKAVNAKNANAVQALLEERKPDFKINDLRWGRLTALEIAIEKLYDGGDQEDLNKVKQIIQRLLDKGAKVRVKTMVMLWSLSNVDVLNDLLQTFPRFRHLSLAYKEKILQQLQQNLEGVRDDIAESQREFNRRWGYGHIPPGYYEAEADLLAIIGSFHAFLQTYNPETGDYLLELPEPNYEVMSMGNEPNGANFHSIENQINDANSNNNNNNHSPLPPAFNY